MKKIIATKAKQGCPSWIAAKQFIDDRGKSLSLAKLDRLALHTLECIATRLQTNQTALHTEEVTLKFGIASRVTLHKCLDRLNKERLIYLTIDREDLRRRVIELTPLARRELSKRDQLFKNWIKENY